MTQRITRKGQAGAAKVIPKGQLAVMPNALLNEQGQGGALVVFASLLKLGWIKIQKGGSRIKIGDHNNEGPFKGILPADTFPPIGFEHIRQLPPSASAHCAKVEPQ